jgi:glycosyltransferase involved in cell wall biosynthesis
MSAAAPRISFVVIFHNMRREAPRTLYSLSGAYQQRSGGIDYEVIAIDNGSTEPLSEETVVRFGANFRYRYFETESASPCEAINAAAEAARGEFIVVCIDGARILSPGVVPHMALATRIAERPVISTLAWHLGAKRQNVAMAEGYDQAVEDALLARSGWEEDGYRLFSISSLAGSSDKGWFLPINESNCIGVPRAVFEELGGFEVRFQSPGGGLANMDFLKRACELPGTELIVLLGEGTFHQFHGGVATNSPLANHPFARFATEYERLRGQRFAVAKKTPLYFGTMPNAALPFLKISVDTAIAASGPKRGDAP